MDTVSAICDAIGRTRLQAALGVGKTAISNAVVENRFPSSWFDVVDRLCREDGIDCPREFFAFRRGDAA